MEDATTIEHMKEMSEPSAEDIRENLITYLNHQADALLTAEGLEQAFYHVKRYVPDGYNGNLLRTAAVAASTVSDLVRQLAEYAEKICIDDMNDLLDTARYSTEYQLFNPELVLDIKSMHMSDGVALSVAATDMLGLDIYNSIRWRVKEINEALKKEGN